MTQRQDDTPTRPTPIAVAELDGFRNDPRDVGRFTALRQALRSSGQGELLAEVCELRAPFEPTPSKAADLWAEAGEARAILGQAAVAERDLRAACALDAAHEVATARLVETFVTTGRPAEAGDILEAELDELAKRAEVSPAKAKVDRAGIARRAARHRLAAGLWEQHLGRVDRALAHWQAAWRLEPERTDALAAARALYASLGDDAMVAKLYRSELDVLGDKAPPLGRAGLWLALAKVELRRGDGKAAAAACDRAVRLDAESLAARETLAEIYSSPSWAKTAEDAAAGGRKASELYAELGRLAFAAGDTEAGIGFLRRAVGADPFHATAATALDQALRREQRWDELERLLVQRVAMAAYAGDEAERVRLLRQRVELHERERPDRGQLIEALTEVAATEPPGGAAAVRLRTLLREDQRWAELAALHERELAALTEPGAQVAELLELAAIVRDHLGDKDRAAELLHQALSVDPANDDALARYVEHFRERRDFRGLCDLYEFSLDNAREAGAPAGELVRRLEEIAQICELRLGDVPRALDAWRRIEEVEPGSPKAKEAVRRLSGRAKMWEQLVAVLEGEAQAAQTGGARADTLRRIANTYRERQVEPRRAIALYEEVLGLKPDDEAALKALIEMYEREGDDAGLARTLRRQLELDARRLAEDPSVGGAREWPVGKRVERLTALRKLATMCETRLGDVEGVVYAASGVLEILPGDRDALDRMARALEQAGDKRRLTQTLEYHAAAATGPAERSMLLRGLARMAADDGDDARALERWEQALRAAPTDPEALAAVADLYERAQRWGELAAVLERLDAVTHPATAAAPEPGSTAAALRARDLTRYAVIVDDKLGDGQRAITAWERLRQLTPRDRTALEALARLYRGAARYRELADLLAVHAEVYAVDDLPKATAAARERAAILADRLGATEDACKQLERLVAELNPTDLDAHSILRRLYEARGDYQASVRIAERELYLLSEPAAKVARALDIGVICRDRIGDPARALQAYERVLALDPHHDEALAAAADLHEKLGDVKGCVRMIERRLSLADDRRTRRAMHNRIAGLTAERLGEHKAGFKAWRRAHDEAPDPATLAELRRAAEAYGLWRELAEVYESERKRLTSGPAADPAAAVAIGRELASVCERRLSDRPRAMAALGEALAGAPRDRELLAEIERLAAEADQRPLWKQALDSHDVALRAIGGGARADLHVRKARILEERLADPRGAAAELLAAFAWGPERDDVREALYRLAAATRTWAEVIAVEAAIAERAAGADRLAALRRRAQVIEEHQKDLPRAFRCHLVAFMLAPEDPELLANLWRLARAIGKYREVDRAPRPEPPPATISLDRDAELPPRREQPTEELVLPEAEPLDDADALEANLDVGDSTQPIDLDELLPPSEAVAKATRPAAGKPRLPPPPPRSLRIEPRPPGPPPTPRKAQASVRRPPLPQLPLRAFESPWEELAAAYDLLPAVDAEAKLRWLYRAAEAWEGGARDVGRAFDTLARALGIARRSVGADGEVRARLHRLASDHGVWERLADLYEALAEDTHTPEAAVELLMEVAAIRERQGETGRAEAQYRRVLGMRPDDRPARAKLESLYRGGQRWVELAASLEERTDPRLGTAAPEAERPALLRELAAIYDGHLGHPHDAIDTLERLRQLAPTDLVVLRELGDLYAKVGRWSKVIEAHGKIVEQAEGAPEAREALRRIAAVYELELELPERALDSYQALVAQWPDDVEALAALDRLCLAAARYRELADVLRRRAALAVTPAERASLLVRRAAVLQDWLAAPEEAAAALRHARTIAPDDRALVDRLVAALVAAGRHREAATVLDGQLAAAGPDVAAGDRAALLLRLAQLRQDGLGDLPGARTAVAAALELVPSHPTALAMLARLADDDDDPRNFAEAKLREAAVATDDDVRIAALYEAGVALRDRVDDAAGARAAFEQLVAVRPYHADAVWALAGLIEQGGDPETAARLLEQRLTDRELEPAERARVLTQLAALARQGGIELVAERRLVEALGADPGCVPAVVALADLYADAARWDDLETFLRGTLADGVPGAEPVVIAELHRRLAECYEQLGRDDDAYETLLAADRLHRGHALVKLALGENRYKAKRWREAALHLSALAHHDDAARYASDVAQGLYHAALAEIRSLRPDKAPPLYARALELRPSYGPALQAMAELAMEANDAARAYELLTRQAVATDEPGERLRLFEALGDMALMMLADEDKARVCFEAAVAAANPLEARHVPLLEKLLERHDLAGDHAGAARTAELMAAFGASGTDRAARLDRAARDYLVAGARDQARAVAVRAVAADPYFLDAVELASELCEAAGDSGEVTDMLGRFLSGKDDGDPADRPRRAALWVRLGEARRARGDSKSAHAALERAIALAPDSDAATTARRRLAPVLAAEPARRGDLVELRRALAAASAAAADVAAWADELRRADRTDAAVVALELALALGASPDVHQTAFRQLHPARAMAADESYRGVVDAPTRARFLHEPDLDQLGPVWSTLAEAASLLWPDPDEALARAGVAGAHRIAGASSPSALAFVRIAAALGCGSASLYATDDPRAPEVQVVCAGTPIVVLGPRAAAGVDRARRFALGAAAELTRPEHAIVAGLPVAEVGTLLAALVRSFAPPASHAAVAALVLDPDVQRARDEALRGALPVKLRQRFEQLFAELPPTPLTLTAHLAAVQRVATRAALLVSGDYGAALTQPNATATEVVRTVTDPDYVALRARLGLAVT
ncbi:MAG: tetratricopeptide repeat protein [Kofleriaceae bacterium]